MSEITVCVGTECNKSIWSDVLEGQPPVFIDVCGPFYDIRSQQGTSRYLCPWPVFSSFPSKLKFFDVCLQVAVPGVPLLASFLFSTRIPVQGLPISAGRRLPHCIANPSQLSLEDLLFDWLLLDQKRQDKLLTGP